MHSCTLLEPVAQWPG